MKPRLLNPLHFVTFSLASASLAHADSATWNGTTDATWADPTNWSADPAPVPGSADTATFDNAGNANTTLDLGAGITISSIVFDSVDAAAYTIGSGGAGAQELTLEDNGSIIVNETVNTNQIFNANLTLGADGSTQSYAVTNSVGNPTMSFTGGVSGGTGGIAGAKTLDVDASGGVVFSGIIADGGASSLAIQKSGSGNLTLTGVASTLTGGIHITAGTLTISSNGSANDSTISLGAAGNTGTSVKIGVINSTTNPSSPLTVVDQTDGEPTTRILSTISNTSGQWSGAITMNDDLTVGALVTNAANVYNFTLNSGATVDLGSNTLTLQSTSPGSAIANGVISGDGDLIVDCSSTGSAVLGANNTYTGTTTINAGTLQLGNNGTTGSISTTSSLTNNGILAFRRNNTVTQGTDFPGALGDSGAIRVIGSNNVIFNLANTYAGTTSIGNSGKLTVATGGSIAPVTGAALNVGFNSGSGTFQYDSAATSKFAGIIVGNGTNNVGILNQTNGTINATSLTLSNTFSAGTGTVTIGNDSGDSAAMNLTGNATVCVASSGNASTLTVKNTGSLAIGGALQFSTSTARSANGVLTQSGGSISAASLSLSSNVSDTSARTHTSVYHLDGGTLTTGPVTAGAIVGSPTTGSHAINATFNFNGGTLKPAASSANFWDANTVVTANVKDGGAKIDTAGFDIAIGQPLLKFAGSTTDTLTKDGLGKLTLAGTNTYTGATTVNAGTLEVSGSLDATAVEVKADATLAGSGALGGSVVVREDGHLAFDVAASAGSQVPMAITGSLTLEPNTVIDLAAAAPPAVGGPYVLLTATGGISGSLGSFTFSGVSGSLAINGSNLELTVTAPAGYAGWIDDFGLAVADQDPTDDPDNDGMDNLLEFVLNGNPSISDPSNLPDLVVTATDFEFTFQRRDDSVSPETTQTFQWGTTLATWPGSAVIPATSGSVGAATITVSAGTPDDGVTDTVKISIPKTQDGGSGKLFGRLQVTKP